MTMTTVTESTVEQTRAVAVTMSRRGLTIQLGHGWTPDELSFVSSSTITISPDDAGDLIKSLYLHGATLPAGWTVPT